jgi:hypothetical protein
MIRRGRVEQNETHQQQKENLSNEEGREKKRIKHRD